MSQRPINSRLTTTAPIPAPRPGQPPVPPMISGPTGSATFNRHASPAAPSDATLLAPPPVSTLSQASASASSSREPGAPSAVLAPTAPASSALDAEGAIREVFLSPRVIDREAFNDYAQSLRALITEAGTHAGDLRAAAHEADAARAALRDATTTQQTRADAITRLLSAVEERANAADRILASARDAAAALESMRAGAEGTISRHVATVEGRLGTILARVEARLTDLEEAAARRESVAQSALDAAVATARHQIDDHAEHARADLGSRAGRIVGELASTAQSAAEEIGRAAEETRAALRASESEAAQQAHVLEVRLAAAAQRLDQSAKSADDRARLHQQELTDLLARVEDAAAEAEALMGWSNAPAALPDTTPLEELYSAGDDDSAVSLDADASNEAVPAPHTPAPLPGSLGDLISKAHAAADRIHEGTARVDSLANQAQQTRAILADAIVAGTSRVDALSSRLDTLRTQLDQALASADSARQRLDDDLARAHSAASAPLEALDRRADDAARTVQTVLEHAERSRDLASSALADTRGLLTRLASALDELRPWRPLLDGTAAGPDAVPQPIRAIVEEVRSQIARDLGVIAAGMYQVAVRTQRTSESLAAAPAPAAAPTLA